MSLGLLPRTERNAYLKDRKGRELSYDDLTHYQNVIAALARTLELQAGIDAALAAAGGWPLA